MKYGIKSKVFDTFYFLCLLIPFLLEVMKNDFPKKILLELLP